MAEDIVESLPVVLPPRGDPPHRLHVGVTRDGFTITASGRPRPQPAVREDEHVREIRQAVAAAIGDPVVVTAKHDETGEIRGFVSWPRDADRKVAEAVALASLPLDFTPIGDFAPETRESDPALTAAAVKAARKRGRDAVVRARREAAEAYFARVEEDARLRAQKRPAMTKQRTRRKRGQTVSVDPLGRTRIPMPGDKSS